MVLAFLLGHRYSHETISALTEQVLNAAVASRSEHQVAFRKRPLPREMAFVDLDGLVLRLFQEGEGGVRVSVYVAIGVSPAGERKVLGYWLFPSEHAFSWESVLRGLRERRLEQVLLFITDGLSGLAEAIQRAYPRASWQRCVVHGVRGSLAQVKPRDRGQLAEDLRRVYGAQSRKEALQALEELRRAWGARYPRGVEMGWGDSGAFLRVLWPYLRSTNLMERFIREIRRGTKVRDHKFPNPDAVYKLLYLEGERQEGRWSERKLRGFAEAQEVLDALFSPRRLFRRTQ